MGWPAVVMAMLALAVVGLAGGYLMTQATPVHEAAAPALPGEPGGHGLAAQLQRRGYVLRHLMYRDVALGTVLCGTEELGRSPRGQKVYLWLQCGDYATGPSAAELAEGEDAAVVTLAGHGATRHVVRVAIPAPEHRDGDISRMFPPSVREEVYAGQFAVTPDAVHRLQIARRL